MCRVSFHVQAYQHHVSLLRHLYGSYLRTEATSRLQSGGLLCAKLLAFDRGLVPAEVSVHMQAQVSWEHIQGHGRSLVMFRFGGQQWIRT